MKIARYVGELLFDYECVVIPGLGGFIAEDKPVKVNRVTDKFSPPFRKIHFNLHLRANDGLLINFVAAEENISYKVAKQRVDKFVFLCHNALEKGKKINFKHIGSIYFDDDKNIVFKQDEAINYNADSFGLSSVVSPSIRRTSDEEKIKNVVKSALNKSRSKEKASNRTDVKPKVEKKRSNYKMQANRRPSLIRNQILFLASLMFLMGLGYVYMRRDAMMYYYDKYSSRIPLFYTNVNEYLSDNINSMPVATISQGTASFFPFVLDDNSSSELGLVGINKNDSTEIIEVIEPVTDQEPEVDLTDDNVSKEPIYEDAENETDANPEIVSEEKTVVPGNNHVIVKDKFFIIAGSFSKEQNAIRLVNELKSKGYRALIADTNRYGMYRVAFMSFNNRAEADQKLLAIREDANPKAWLLAK